MGGLVPGVAEMIPAYRDTRGYHMGYDTQQTPFEVAKERGLAGVLGGTADIITRGYTDFDKRGDSKKQKDTKEFLNKFIHGTAPLEASMEDDRKRLERTMAMRKFQQGMQERANLYNEMKH